MCVCVGGGGGGARLVIMVGASKFSKYIFIIFKVTLCTFIWHICICVLSLV